MPQQIDLDRPYILREDGNAGPRSIPIFMYKDEPGVYRLANGNLCSDDLARAAMFDVDSDRLQLRMIEKEAEAMAAIKTEFEEKKELIREAARKEIADEDEAQQLKRDTGETGGIDLKTTTGEMDPNGIRTTATGEPRETPTRIMKHQGQGIWSVIDKASGEAIEEGLEKEEAQTLLLAES